MKLKKYYYDDISFLISRNTRREKTTLRDVAYRRITCCALCCQIRKMKTSQLQVYNAFTNIVPLLQVHLIKSYIYLQKSFYLLKLKSRHCTLCRAQRIALSSYISVGFLVKCVSTIVYV